MFLTLLSGPFPFLSYRQLGLLPGVNEPRVGPAHPSRQPLAPAASGMLQPPSFLRQPWLPAPTPACQGPIGLVPPHKNPKSYCI